MEPKTYILYHAFCYDGFAAAWAAWKLFRDRATYIPVNYGMPMPKIEDGAKVYILDFSYPREELDQLYERVDVLRVIDHHKSAEHELKHATYAIFDPTRCGARLAWEYFHDSEKAPPLLHYIEDRDLWKWEYRGSHEINQALRLYSMTPEPASFIAFDDIEVGDLYNQGRVILKFVRAEVDRIIENRWTETMDGYEVPVVNTQASFISETAHRLLEVCPEAKFVAVYFDRGDAKRVWSLRSRKGEGYDCSYLAQLHGGGGHVNAAGWTEMAPKPQAINRPFQSERVWAQPEVKP